MFDRPRNWKWMVPAALIAPCLVWWEIWNQWGGSWSDWAVVPGVLVVILFLAALMNAYLYYEDHKADIYANFQMARNSTPEVRMFEAAKGMHPEAVKALLVHRRSVWAIKYYKTSELVDWVLFDVPAVHVGFVDFILDHSNGSIMPKRFLSEGSKQYDPEGLITDYEQYDALIHYMQQNLMITQAYGNQAPQLLPPWTVETMRHRFGLDGEGAYVDDRMSSALMAVIKEQGKSNQQLAVSSNGVKQLPAENETKPMQAIQSKKVEKLPELTEAELLAMEEEQKRYAGMYSDGKVPS